MINKCKIVFGNLSNEEAIKKFKLNPPFFLFGMPREQYDEYFQKIKQENPKRFEILKKYIEEFESKNNGVQR